MIEQLIMHLGAVWGQRSAIINSGYHSDSDWITQQNNYCHFYVTVYTTRREGASTVVIYYKNACPSNMPQCTIVTWSCHTILYSSLSDEHSLLQLMPCVRVIYRSGNFRSINNLCIKFSKLKYFTTWRFRNVACICVFYFRTFNFRCLSNWWKLFNGKN